MLSLLTARSLSHGRRDLFPCAETPLYDVCIIRTLVLGQTNITDRYSSAPRRSYDYGITPDLRQPIDVGLKSVIRWVKKYEANAFSM